VARLHGEINRLAGVIFGVVDRHCGEPVVGHADGQLRQSIKTPALNALTPHH